MKRFTLFSKIRRTSRYRTFPMTAAVLAGLTVPLLGIGAASAAPGMWEAFHDPGGTDIQEDFCGVAGLTVENSYVVDGRFRTSTRGADGLSYYAQIAQSTDYWTNVATGEYVTFEMSYEYFDHKVTDNGDGTLTETVQTTGTGALYDQDGQQIARTAGLLFHFQLVFDHAGTPTDPSDDVFLEFIPLETAGTDFGCEVIAEAIG